MKLVLTVTEGPHLGKEFSFDGHDSFLVGRVRDAHLQLSYDDPYFSRRHFVLDVNPPRCRLMDLKSRNGTYVNGERVSVAEIKDGDNIKAGHTVFKVSLVVPPERQVALDINKTVTGPQYWVPREETKATLGGYEIVKELGRGGMGVVYQARRLADGASVALKTIVPVAGSSDRHIDRFVREAKILERLRHPNIVGFLQTDRDGDVIYLAMELANGPDAGKILAKNGPMSVKKAVRIVCQMLSGLSHAHELGFVHRDIKPSNMLTHLEDGKKTTKLADFGLARAYEASELSGLTLQGEIGGSPAFMPPEQITHYRDVLPTADQYSAAATLYTLLTAKCVHDLPTDMTEALIHISVEEPIPICDRRSDIPKGLAEVVHTALSREAEERFADVGELRGELMRWA